MSLVYDRMMGEHSLLALEVLRNQQTEAPIYHDLVCRVLSLVLFRCHFRLFIVSLVKGIQGFYYQKFSKEHWATLRDIPAPSRYGWQMLSLVQVSKLGWLMLLRQIKLGWFCV